MTTGFLFVVLLAGCAGPPRPTAQVQAPAPSGVGADGEYRGTTTRFQADSRSCPRPGLVSVIVFDNRFQYRWDRDTWLDATIGPDGAVGASEEGITLEGRLEGARLEGDVTNGICGFHFTLRRSGA